MNFLKCAEDAGHWHTQLTEIILLQIRNVGNIKRKEVIAWPNSFKPWLKSTVFGMNQKTQNSLTVRAAVIAAEAVEVAIRVAAVARCNSQL